MKEQAHDQLSAQKLYSFLKEIKKTDRRSVSVKIYDGTNEETFSVCSVKLTPNNEILIMFR